MITALSGISASCRRRSTGIRSARITRYSDNAAANQVLELMAGSDEGGAARMVAFVKSLGLTTRSWRAGT